MPKAERGAAPAGGIRNPALGRLRDPPSANLGADARSSLTEKRQCFTKSADPDDRNRRGGAPKGVPASVIRRRPIRRWDRPDREAGHGCGVPHQRLSALRPLLFVGGMFVDAGEPHTCQKTECGALAKPCSMHARSRRLFAATRAGVILRCEAAIAASLEGRRHAQSSVPSFEARLREGSGGHLRMTHAWSFSGDGPVVADHAEHRCTLDAIALSLPSAPPSP